MLVLKLVRRKTVCARSCIQLGFSTTWIYDERSCCFLLLHDLTGSFFGVCLMNNHSCWCVLVCTFMPFPDALDEAEDLPFTCDFSYDDAVVQIGGEFRKLVSKFKSVKSSGNWLQFGGELGEHD